jgi:hypothetical protein
MVSLARKQGKDFDAEWTRTLAAQRQRQAEDERPREIAGTAR